MKRILGIDIETYSPVPLPKTGVYRYVDTDEFEILLFSYAYDDGPVQTVDLACGEKIPDGVLTDLENPDVIKTAYNAQFERVCLSKYFGHWLDPHQWRCTAVMAAYLTMPARLADAAVALAVTEQKMEEGKDLIRFFSTPCKPTKANDGRTRNLPEHAPDKWAVYKQYNAQDVETERAVRKACEAHPMPESEWELYALDQIINDRGVRVDKLLVKQAMTVDSEFTEAAYQRAKEITGLDNPGSVAQLKAWLADQDVPMESLAKKLVQEKAANTEALLDMYTIRELQTLNLSIKTEYYTTAEQDKEFDTAVKKVLAQLCVDGMSDYEKVRAIYKYICSNVTYDEAHLNDDGYTLKYTGYAALKNHTAVCAGVADLFYYMANTAGLEARVVTSSTHAWNFVKLGGKCYYLDATWDLGKGEGEYQFFLKGKYDFNHFVKYNLSLFGFGNQLTDTDKGYTFSDYAYGRL